MKFSDPPNDYTTGMAPACTDDIQDDGVSNSEIVNNMSDPSGFMPDPSAFTMDPSTFMSNASTSVPKDDFGFEVFTNPSPSSTGMDPAFDMSYGQAPLQSHSRMKCTCGSFVEH
jgi:hypothetical protein